MFLVFNKYKLVNAISWFYQATLRQRLLFPILKRLLIDLIAGEDIFPHLRLKIIDNTDSS